MLRPTSHLHKSIILFIASLAMFMEGLDTTILNTAIPSMASSLQINPIDLKIALISYLLSLAVFIPISGWLADTFGIKSVFIGAMSLFVLSSALCGGASHLLTLVLARLLQGLGGALMVPLARLMVLRTFERHLLITTMSRVVMVGALGTMLGPVLGGILTHNLSWHWIFWVNIPVGFITLLLAWYFLPNSPTQATHSLDFIGFLLFGGSLSLLTFALSALSEDFLSFYTSLSLSLLALALLVTAFMRANRQPYPVINTQLFKYHSFQVSTSANFLARLGFGGIPFLLPLLLQITLGYSAQVAGFLMAPIAIGIVLVKAFTMPLMRLLGYKKMLITNTVLISGLLLALTLIDAHTPLSIIALITLCFGLLLALQFGAMNSLAYVEISLVQLSSASSITSTIQQLATSFGVAVSALLLHFITIDSHEKLFSLANFHHVFACLALITLASTMIFLRLGADEGAQLLTPRT